MKISCELPLDILNENYKLNDYDFVLFHLYISNEKYKQYYKAMRIVHPDRLMILDNSAYEFYIKGERLDLMKYKQAIEDLNPDYYILPDVLMDREETLNLVDEYINNYTPNSDARPMAVIQGKSEQELLQCINIYKQNNINNICIPFHNSFFKDITRDPDLENSFADEYQLDSLDDLTEDMKYAMGRVMFIVDNNKILDDFEYVHLLGSHCPYEKSFYSWINVSSMDTGYPVKLALEHKILGREKKKPDIIIDDFFNRKLDITEKSLISANIRLFKEY